MLAGVAQEVEQRQRGEPVGVVEQLRRLRSLEVEELGQLRLNGARVFGDGLQGLQRAFAAPATGVANHARATPHQCDGPVTGPLQVDEAHHGHEVAHVQARRRGVESAVPGDLPRRERGREAFGVLEQQLAPGEFGQGGRELGHFYKLSRGWLLARPHACR